MSDQETFMVDSPTKSISKLLRTEQHGDLLQKWLKINMDQLGAHLTGDLEEDLYSINHLTMRRFLMAIELMLKFIGCDHTNFHNIDPYVLPHIRNVLNEKDQRIDSIPDFRGSLYAPQMAMIKRMADMEESGPLSIMDKFYYSNVSVISERFSFGKTFMMPAFFLYHPITNIFEDIDGSFFHYGWEPTPKESPFIKTNIVICGSKVIKDWEKNIKTFTPLTFVKIVSAKGLDKMEEAIKEENFPQVILIKDRFITWKGAKKYAVEHFEILFGSRTANRMVIDDYDVINITYRTILPNSRYTWLISSSHETSSKYIDVSDRTLGKIYKRMPVIDFYNNLKCNTDFSALEFNIPKIDFYKENQLVSNLIDMIINGTPNFEPSKIWNEKCFIKANEDIPYDREKYPPKILVSIEIKEDRLELQEELKRKGISSILLDRRNIHTFDQKEESVGISRLIYGVNMGYLTHVIIDDFYDVNEVMQIVGRAQRIGRKHNLQAYVLS
jgi:hypothetical protein